MLKTGSSTWLKNIGSKSKINTTNSIGYILNPEGTDQYSFFAKIHSLIFDFINDYCKPKKIDEDHDAKSFIDLLINLHDQHLKECRIGFLDYFYNAKFLLIKRGCIVFILS